MAARKTRRLTDDWKARIQTSMLVNRLHDFANGKIEMSGDQGRAAWCLIKKTAPDLSSVQHSGDEDNPMRVIHSLGPDLAKKLDRLTHS